MKMLCLSFMLLTNWCWCRCLCCQWWREELTRPALGRSPTIGNQQIVFTLTIAFGFNRNTNVWEKLNTRLRSAGNRWFQRFGCARNSSKQEQIEALPLKGGKIYFSFVGPFVMTLVYMIIIRMYGRLISNSPILQHFCNILRSCCTRTRTPLPAPDNANAVRNVAHSFFKIFLDLKFTKN